QDLFHGASLPPASSPAATAKGRSFTAENAEGAEKRTKEREAEKHLNPTCFGLLSALSAFSAVKLSPLVEVGEGFGQAMSGIVVGPSAGGAAEGPAALRVVQQRARLPGQGVLVARLDQEAVDAVLDQVGRPGDAPGDDRLAGDEGLEHGAQAAGGP